ncbi:MAG: twin-arginine translocase TatA/TatE family subunit [Sumerlaeia bacterium]
MSTLQTLAFLPNLSPLEIFVIFMVVLLIFGPKSLPALGRSMGKAMREFRMASSKFQESLTDYEDEDDARKDHEAPKKERSRPAGELASEKSESIEAPREKEFAPSAPSGPIIERNS